MKTSNKLLIAFAAALIVIPLLGMVYISRVKYKVGTYADIAANKVENFSTPTKNMTSISLPVQFNAVNIDDAKGLSVGFRFVKDDKFGIKIPDELKDVLVAKVDANGKLQLTVTGKIDSGSGDYMSIMIYAPTLKDITVAKAADAYLTATVDSITFNVKDAKSIRIGSGTHIKQLNLNASQVPQINLYQDDVKSLTLALENANLRTEKMSYEKLVVNTSGTCEVEIRGDYEQSKIKYNVKDLVLNTVGKTDVKFENIIVANCAGSLSDETMVQMPAANLNQMYKK